jgi:cell division protein FtsQ
MSKITSKKQTHAAQSRGKDLAFSVLATPLNILAILLRLMWSTRRIRLASLVVVCALMVTALFRFAPLAPAADYVRTTAHHVSGQAGFRIDDITVEGRMRTQRDDLVQAVQLDLKTPIFSIDLDAVHARVRQLPWVHHVVVSRRLPNIIHISLQERTPFALFNDHKSVVLMDRSGTKITGNHLQKFSHLPMFSGQGASLRAASLMDVLKDYPVIRNRLVAAKWTGDRRWDLSLDHGGVVRLPDQDIHAALDRLMELERERRILTNKNQAIDLRLPDRILLRPGHSSSRQKLSFLAKEAS